MFHTFSLLSVHFEVIQLMPFIFHKFISPSSQPAFSAQHHPVNLCYTILIGTKIYFKDSFYLYRCACEYDFHACVCVPVLVETWSGFWIPWKCRYRSLWAVELWELNWVDVRCGTWTWVFCKGYKKSLQWNHLSSIYSKFFLWHFSAYGLFLTFLLKILKILPILNIVKEVDSPYSAEPLYKEHLKSVRDDFGCSTIEP